VVSDNGPGVAEQDRERVFDPFFTTKPPGQGTGLGLSNARHLAEELGGTLELAANGPGARFVLRLPGAGCAAGCGVRTRVRGEAAGEAPTAESESQA
jgi:signal transduction histidine kinase